MYVSSNGGGRKLWDLSWGDSSEIPQVPHSSMERRKDEGNTGHGNAYSQSITGTAYAVKPLIFTDAATYKICFLKK